jgi:hypothetical protein
MFSDGGRRNYISHLNNIKPASKTTSFYLEKENI